ncbi:ATP-binding protein [Lacibacter sp.]|uniref:ATP-binding protein n=1 Tax=Lacibacter sp. TaxID=1915409 RepID=UPI002B4B8905|nr:ATP-binding protein [Lacibacter sp.]HLP37593.1 ATP-binding protein [Lacibacter sp.]
MDLQLYEVRHPNPVAQNNYDNLIAIDEQKSALLNTLHLFFDTDKVNKWHKKYHHSKLNFFENILSGTPLVILEGDVGCGKTALAHTIATPLGKLIDKRVFCFETPSNIRGAGRVGEISNRITEAFTQAKSKVRGNDIGILIIDEADDLATDREQNQAHHEDRAGLNVLIKQIDSVGREKTNLAVVLITNRLKALDPAVVRRATQIIRFDRPDKDGRKEVFKYIFAGTDISIKEIDELVKASERKDTAYSFSDLIQKIAKQALFHAIEEDKPLDKNMYIKILEKVQPSPSIK